MEIKAHENKRLTRGWQFTGELKPILNFGAVVHFIQDALSNSLILKKIFTFLDSEDLESCCHVCQDWRTAADPLVLSQYEIKLDRIYAPYNPHLAKHYVFVRGRARYNRQSFTQRTNISGVIQMFEVLRTQNVSISLKISEAVDTQDDQVIDFISKIGPLVLELDLSGIIQLPVNVVDFCKLLPRIFPNLKKLNCSGFCPYDDFIEEPSFNTHLPQNQYKQLKTISFGSQYLSLSSIGTILKTCECLEEIESFPLELIKAVVIAGKGEALKSLFDTYNSNHRFQQNGLTIVIAYKKLARLEPKLTTLDIDLYRFPSYDEVAFQKAKPFLFSILQSSHESLESLRISPLKPEDFQFFPILQGLKELTLFPRYREHGFFFPPTENIQVRVIFPNVRTIISRSTWDVAYINRYFPENIVTPWGTRIHELRIIGRMDVNCLPLVQKLFPSLQKLRLNIPGRDIPNFLLQLSRFWPELKSLEFIVKKYYHLKERNLMDGKPLRLDQAFTGLPEKVIDQLEDPQKKMDFTEEQIQEFKDGSIIRKLKELKELKLFLGDYRFASGLERGTYMRLTPVANEFGFKLLPELKVTVGIRKDQMFAKEMEKDLQPLAMYSNVELIYDFPFL